MSFHTRIAQIKTMQRKLTKTRIAVIELFESEYRPISAAEIIAHLHTHNLPVNKTTVYRELAFLLTHNLIREVRLTDRELHYETTSMQHHHHIVCTGCEKIEGVESTIVERELNTFQDAIAQEKNFTIHTHMLEFYGLCNACQKGAEV